MTLSTREIDERDEAAFLEGAEAFAGEDPDWYSFAWRPGTPYRDMLAVLRSEASGKDLPPGRVPATMLYGFVDGAIVGRVSIRHHLTPALEERGGHLGYAVAPRYRRRGHGAALMRDGLAFCRTRLGLQRILVTCADDNAGSIRIIENAGGRLRDKVTADDELARRYDVPC